MKYLVWFSLFSIILAAACGKNEFEQPKPPEKKGNVQMKALVETSMGDFTIEFYHEDAPNTVDNFVKLSEKGFYDGLTFHRVVKGFVIQGGDPRGNGTGGPGYTIAAEFNGRPHLLGTVAMARGPDINSAGSQWYVCLDKIAQLDGKYTVFGQVTEGVDVVKKIGEVKVDNTDKPLEPVTINRITIQK